MFRPGGIWLNINNERGAALPLVLTIVIVMSLLGTAIWQYSVTDTLNVSREEHKMQAYYLARSGADLVASAIITNSVSAAALINAPKSSPVNLGDGSFEVDVAGNLNNITINSTGIVNDVSQSTNLSLTKLTPKEIFNNVIYAKEPYDVTKMNVSGSLESNNTIGTSSGYGYAVKPNSSRYFPPPIIPNLTSKGSLSVGNKDTTTVNEDGEYTSIDVSNGGTLIFDTKGGTLRIVTSTLTSKDTIRVIGGGTLLLYIRNTAYISTKGIFNDVDKNNLVLFLADGVNVSFTDQAGMDFYGYIYGPTATVDLQSAKSSITGALIANDFNGSNNTTLTFVDIPNDIDLGITLFKRGQWSN